MSQILLRKRMKKLVYLLACIATVGSFCTSCSSSKTYAEMLDDEKGYIANFIATKGINVVNESSWNSKEKMAENDFVLFKSDGVYMHIDSLGEGKPLYNVLDSLSKKVSGSSARLIITTRFMEYSLQYMDTVITNLYTNDSPEQFYYAKNTSTSSYSSSSTTSTYGKFFTSNDQTSTTYLMTTYYSSTSVPSGWLKPLEYVGNGGRVKVIVPSKMGHSTAQTSVMPYYYVLQYSVY